MHAQVEPASRSPLAASHQGSRSNSRSHDGFVSVSSASKSSGSQHDPDNLPAPSQAASESSRVQPPSASPPSARDGVSTEHAPEPQPPQQSTLNVSDEPSSLQPGDADPCNQSLHALHAEQQESQPQAPQIHSQKPASHQSSPALQEARGVQQDNQHLTATVSTPQVAALSSPAAVQSRKSGESSSTAAASSAASADAGSTEAGSDAVNACSVGSASTDAWEMVQDANNIYNWKAGSLFGRSLSSSRRQGSECSEEGESYSKCERGRSQSDV